MKRATPATSKLVAKLTEGLIGEVKAAEMYEKGARLASSKLQRDTFHTLIAGKKKHAQDISDLIDRIE
ncbi:MAG: hypothetical protein ABH829_01140 [archaeon]